MCVCVIICTKPMYRNKWKHVSKFVCYFQDHPAAFLVITLSSPFCRCSLCLSGPTLSGRPHLWQVQPKGSLQWSPAAHIWLRGKVWLHNVMVKPWSHVFLRFRFIPMVLLCSCHHCLYSVIFHPFVLMHCCPPGEIARWCARGCSCIADASASWLCPGTPLVEENWTKFVGQSLPQFHLIVPFVGMNFSLPLSVAGYTIKQTDSRSGRCPAWWMIWGSKMRISQPHETTWPTDRSA